MKTLTVFLVLGLLAHTPASIARATHGPPPTVTTSSSAVPKLFDLATSKLLPGWILASFESGPPKYSRDGGRSWLSVATTPWTNMPYGRQSVEIIPKEPLTGPPRFLLAVDSDYYQPQNGLYRSGDLGQTWAREVLDMRGCNTNDMFFDWLEAVNAHPKRVFFESICFYETDWASAASYRKQESVDRAVSWLTSTMVLELTQAPVVTDAIYALRAVSDTLKHWRSQDGGDTWTDVSFPYEKDSRYWYLHAIGAENILYASTSIDPLTGSYIPNTSMVRSSDGGKSWTLMKRPGACQILLTQFIAHPTIAGLVFLECGTNGVGPFTLYKSTDFGETWTEMPGSTGAKLMVDHGHAGRLLSDCPFNTTIPCGGLWFSDDGGVTWSQLTKDFSGLKVYLPIVYRRLPV